MTELYLSRLVLHAQSRRVQRDLADCYAMHQRILSAFPDASDGATVSKVTTAREQFGVLYRIDATPHGLLVLVQSGVNPDWSRLPEGYLSAPAETKPVGAQYETLGTGTRLAFRLRANTVKRISSGNTSQDERWRGKRIDLRSEEEQLGWLRRKSVTAGFQLVSTHVRPGLDTLADASSHERGVGAVAAESDARVSADARASGRRRGADRGGDRLSFGGATFDGQLVVTDAEAFRRALVAGIGPGKAFGFGLLSIAAPSVVTV